MAATLKRRRMTKTRTEGRSLGKRLAGDAAAIMLEAYDNRTECDSPASDRYNALVAALRAELGPASDTPAIAAAFQALDGAYGDALVEVEDRAWFAAWQAASDLKGGV